MNVTLEQAIQIYARALLHRSGPQASKSARIEAERLKVSGDPQGFDVWLQVADAIEQLESAPPETMLRA